MGGKGKGKRRASKTQGANGENEVKKKSAKRASGRRSGRGGKSRCNVDIFSEGAMENAYYICHNIQDVLKCRGFAWPDAQKKKKKGKGKK